MLENGISSDKNKNELLNKLFNHYQEEKAAADESELNLHDAFKIFEDLGNTRYGEHLKGVLTNQTKSRNKEQEIIIITKSNSSSWMNLMKE